MSSQDFISYVPQDAAVLEALKPWKEVLDEAGKKFIKRTRYDSPYWSNVTIALTTQGNFRVPLEKGILTYSHLYTMCPFENKFVALNLLGSKLLEVLEVGVASMNPNSSVPSSSRMLQVSGLRVTYNISKPTGERVKEVQVRCQKCTIPRFEELDVDRVYRIVVADYLAEGMNGFGVIKENAFDLEIGPVDLDALSEYIEVNNPIVAGLEGRTTVLK